jgi:ADP-ribose pyrophosphatase YjhB (NUDIX family)
MNDKDLYFVAVKVFLEKDGKFVIFKDGFGQWDLPGGRLKPDEFDTPLEDVVHRKMREELGGDLTYTLGKPIVFMRHQRVENAPGNPVVKIFAVGFQANLDAGKLKLGSHHTEILWVDPNNFRPEDYFTGGWLKGVQEYITLKKL